MNIEICDLCKSKEPNKKFKVKLSKKDIIKEQVMVWVG